MFEKVTRLKLRFDSYVGSLTVEDVWDLSLLDLDMLAKSLSKEVKESEEESFIVKHKTSNTILDLKFETVKHIITVKLAENEASEKAVEKKERKEKILSIMAMKQDEELQGKSSDELAELLEAL